MAFWFQRVLAFFAALVALSFGAAPQRWEGMKNIERDGFLLDEVSSNTATPDDGNACCESLQSQITSQSIQIIGLISSLSTANAKIDAFTSSVSSISNQVSASCATPTQVPGFEPQNCSHLKEIGQKLNGFYMVKQSGPYNRVQTVFCDFSTAGSVDQTTIGLNDIKTTSVYFYATRNTKFVGLNAVIPYEIAPVNLGGSLNLATGIFTVPVPGRYFFTFNAASSDGMNFVLLRNGVPQASALIGQGSAKQQSGLQAILNLVPGDQVGISTWFGGVVYDSDDTIGNPVPNFTQFTCQLLEEDLIFS